MILTLTSSIYHSIGSPSHSNQMRKRDKIIQIGRKVVKFSLFANDIILYREKPKVSTPNLLELINKFSEFTGYKINIQKSVASLYTNNEISERKSKNQTLIKSHQEK